MKKIIVVIAVIVLTTAVLKVITFLNIDTIVGVNVDKRESNGIHEYLITHDMKKGQDLEASVAVNFTSLSDGTYQCTVLYNQTENKNYSVRNISVSFIENDSAEIVSCFYSLGNDEFYTGVSSYLSEAPVCKCSSDSNYIYCTLIIKADTAPVPSEFIDLRYDICGKGFYSDTKFTNTAITL